MPISRFLFFTALFATTLRAEDWPQWRGPNLSGISSEKNLPTHWSPTQNIAWKTSIPGQGHSSPIVHGNRVFLTTALEDSQQRQLLCLDVATGQIIWTRTVLTAPLERKHALNNYASSTPATDGRYAYVAFLEISRVWLVCYDYNGNEIWRKSPGQFKSMHGWAAAPILYNDLIILNCDQDADAYLVAFDKTTGAEKWRTDRPNKTRSYCVPLLVEAAGKMQLVLTGSKSVASYDPSTGQQHWVIDGPTEQFVASPVFADDTIFITAGFPTYHIMGIDPSGSGNITKTHIRYHHKSGAYVPSPIAVDGLVFMVSDQPRHEGQAWCYRANTGQRLWSHKLGRHHRPSPIYAAGHLYFLDDEGTTHVVKASEKFELIATNPLNEPASASPAISNGRIYIRSTHHLFCIKNPS